MKNRGLALQRTALRKLGAWAKVVGETPTGEPVVLAGGERLVWSIGDGKFWPVADCTHCGAELARIDLDAHRGTCQTSSGSASAQQGESLHTRSSEVVQPPSRQTVGQADPETDADPSPQAPVAPPPAAPPASAAHPRPLRLTGDSFSEPAGESPTAVPAAPAPEPRPGRLVGGSVSPCETRAIDGPTPEQRWAAGWKRDPWHRFAGRYWDGSEWTERVVSQERILGVDRLRQGPVTHTPSTLNSTPVSSGSREQDPPRSATPSMTRREPTPVREGSVSWPRRARWTLVIVAGGLIIGAAAGIGGDPTRQPIVSGNSMAASDAVSEASAVYVSPCLPAISQMGAILGRLKGGASGMRRPYAVALEPPVGTLRFVVVAEIDGAGALNGDGQVGAWAMAATDGTGLTLPIDETALRYSTWGENETKGSPADQLRDQIAARPEVISAKACIRD